MNDLLLAADIGNTDTVFAIFRGPTLVALWRTPATSLHSAPRTRQILRLLLKESAVRSMGGAVISSVNPAATKILASVLRTSFRTAPYVIAGDDRTGVRVGYRTPGTLGPDRLCNVVAARHLYGAPVIVVDAGTAITVDVILPSGVFAGGAIAPGIATAAWALTSGTAALPSVPLAFPPSVVGRTTAECIQSGVLYGAVDAVDGIIRRMKRITGPGTAVIATGGHAGLLRARSTLIRHVEPTLVLEGARLLYERRRTRRTR